MIEGVGGIVREITGTVIFGVCKVKGKNVERWPTYVLDYINDVLARLMKGETDYKSLIPCRSSYARLLLTGRKNLERGDGLTFPYGRRAKPSLFESVALQSCFTNNRSQQ